MSTAHLLQRPRESRSMQDVYVKSHRHDLMIVTSKVHCNKSHEIQSKLTMSG